MEVWVEEAEEAVRGGGQVGQSEAVQAVAAAVQQSGGVMLLFIRHEEVTSDWLSFFL